MDVLSVQGQGALYTAIVLIAVIIVVHGIKLARIGYRTLGKKLPPDPPPEDKEPREPVYFLVERKTRRNTPPPGASTSKNDQPRFSTVSEPVTVRTLTLALPVPATYAPSAYAAPNASQNCPPAV